MGMFSDYLQNLLVDGLRRGGAVDSAGAANSIAVVKGVWSALTAYALGDVVVPVANAGAGGKFLRCTTAGTSGASFSAALGHPGSTIADGGVTWTVTSGVPAPVVTYVGLLTCTKGLRANSTAYALNDTMAVLTSTGRHHLYKCTTAGTTAASQGALYPGVANESITDGSAVFAEQTSSLDANASAIVEPSGGGYARVAVPASKASWSGTQAPGSTSASTGTGGAASNNTLIAFAVPTGDWTSGPARVWGFAEFDAAAGGNLLNWGPLTTLQSILNGQAAPTVAAGALILTIGI